MTLIANASEPPIKTKIRVRLKNKKHSFSLSSVTPPASYSIGKLNACRHVQVFVGVHFGVPLMQ